MGKFKIKALCGWIITFADKASEVPKGSGFYALIKDIPKIEAATKAMFGCSIDKVSQAKKIMSLGLIKLK